MQQSLKEYMIREKIFLKNSVIKNYTAIVLSVVTFGLITHAYAYFGLLYNHDSLMVISSDNIWQVSLGRYLQPIYLYFRGDVNVPWLNGILSLIYISIFVFFVSLLFNINNKIFLSIVSGLCITNVTITCLNATYLPWLDIFSFSIMLAGISAWLTHRYKYGNVWGALTLTASLGLYQSYLSVYIILIMIVVLIDLIDKKDIASIIGTMFKSISCTIMSSICYLIGSKIALRIVDTELANTYNGLSELGNFSEINVIELFADTYINFFDYFFSLQGINKIEIVISNVLVLLVMVFLVIILIKRNGLKNINTILIISISTLLPFGANMVYFISKGFSYEVMTFAFNLVFIIPIVLINLIEEQYSEIRRNAFFRSTKLIFIICVSVIVLNNIVISNQVYIKRSLVYSSTQTIYNRLLCHIENLDGYVPGVTEVLFVGDLENNSIFNTGYNEFDQINDITMQNADFSVTYSGTRGVFFKYIMNTNVCLTSNMKPSDLVENDILEVMPQFPQKGFCKFYGNILLVKLSDEYIYE